MIDQVNTSQQVQTSNTQSSTASEPLSSEGRSTSLRRGVMNSFFSDKKLQFQLIGVSLLLLVGLVASRIAVSQSQEQRSQAFEPGTVSASFATEQLTVGQSGSGTANVVITSEEGVVPTAAALVLSYDPNSVSIQSVSAGKDFPIKLAEAKIDAQAGVVSITIARSPETPLSGTTLHALTIQVTSKPESRRARIVIDPASQVAVLGMAENALASRSHLVVLNESATTQRTDELDSEEQNNDSRDEVRAGLQPDPRKIEPIGSPIMTTKPSAYPGSMPAPTLEPRPPAI